MSAALIGLSDVTKRYDGRMAVHGVCLESPRPLVLANISIDHWWLFDLDRFDVERR